MKVNLFVYEFIYKKRRRNNILIDLVDECFTWSRLVSNM